MFLYQAVFPAFYVLNRPSNYIIIAQSGLQDGQQYEQLLATGG